MKKSHNVKHSFTKYLVYSTIGLLCINFLLIFLPFIEVYQPSYSKTVLGVTTYEGWYISLAPTAMLIFPIFLTGIPYLCSILSLKKFMKIKNNTLDKPFRFFWLKFGAIANLIMMWNMFSETLSQVRPYSEYGAYCHLTFFGVLNIICTIVFLLLLVKLSKRTQLMFDLNKAD